MVEKKDYDYLFKILILGDSSVGKTNIIKRFLHNDFELNSKGTIGVEFDCKNLMMGEKKEDIVKAQIWDTAGQERYRSVTKAYYRGAKGALVVYDITRRLTFDNIDGWILDLKTNGSKDIFIVLVGNKTDLMNQREVSKEEAETKSEQYDIAFLETSAKTGDNVDKAFNELLEQIYKANKVDKIENTDQVKENKTEVINLEDKKEEKEKEKEEEKKNGSIPN